MHRWERFAALATLKVMEINAQQPISATMNESAMRACPRWLKQQVIAFPAPRVYAMSRHAKHNRATKPESLLAGNISGMRQRNQKQVIPPRRSEIQTPKDLAKERHYPEAEIAAI